MGCHFCGHAGTLRSPPQQLVCSLGETTTSEVPLRAHLTWGQAGNGDPCLFSASLRSPLSWKTQIVPGWPTSSTVLSWEPDLGVAFRSQEVSPGLCW